MIKVHSTKITASSRQLKQVTSAEETPKDIEQEAQDEATTEAQDNADVKVVLSPVQSQSLLDTEPEDKPIVEDRDTSPTGTNNMGYF